MRVSPWSLIRHDVKVTELAIDDADVTVAQLSGLAKPKPADEQAEADTGPSPWTIDVEDLEVQHGHVRIDTTQHDVGDVDLDDIAIGASAHVPLDGAQARAVSIDVHATWRQRQAPIAVSAQLDTAGTAIAVPALEVHVGGVVAAASGVHVTPRDGQLPAVQGRVAVTAPRDAVAALLPRLDLPADVSIAVEAAPGAPAEATPVTVAARVGDASLAGHVLANLDTQAARGELDLRAAAGAGDEIDVAALTRGRVRARAGATIRFDVARGGAGELPHGDVELAARGQFGKVPHATLDARVDSTGTRASARVELHGPATATATADLVRTGDTLSLTSARVIASTDDPRRTSGGAVPVRGKLRVDLSASGALSPKPDVAVRGSVTAGPLAAAGVSMQQLAVTIDARALPAKPTGHATVHVVDLARGDVRFGELLLDAASRPDGRIAVDLTSHPGFAAWAVELAALVTPPGVAGNATCEGPGSAGTRGPAEGRCGVVIDIVRHHVRAGERGGDWSGVGGRVVIAPDRIAVTDLHTASERGRIQLAASLARTGRTAGDLAATVDVTSLQLAALSSGYAGAVEAHVTASRRAGAWAGKLDAHATGVAMHPRAPAIDATATLTAGPGAIAATVDATIATAGSARVALAVAAPQRLDDAAAWRRLGRDAIRSLEVRAHDVDLARLHALVPPPPPSPSAAPATGPAATTPPVAIAGKLDGGLVVSADGATGVLRVKQVKTAALRGIKSVDVSLALARPTSDELDPTVVVHAEGVGDAVAVARLGLPDHPFDPAAWRRLGIAAVRGATVETGMIAVDPAMLDRLGITSTISGKVQLRADVTDGAHSATITAHMRQVRGVPIARPVGIDLTATVDQHAATASIAMETDRSVAMLNLDARIPISLDALRADPRRARTTPLAATLRLPETSAPQLLDTFGKTQITGGTIDGTVTVGGTIASPHVVARLTGKDLVVPPGPHGKPVDTIHRVTVVATWDTGGGTVAVDADGARGGTLAVRARLDPHRLGDGTADITASHFDLAPLLAFAPGPAGGAKATLDAKLAVSGFDPRTARITGGLHLRDARLPLAPTIGTLRDASVDFEIRAHDILVKTTGKLGGGTLALDGAIALDGASLTGGHAKLTLRKVSPIGSVQPDIDADIDAKLARAGTHWRADVVVDHGFIKIGKTGGEKLEPVGLPNDLVIGKQKRKIDHEVAAAPKHPIIVVHVVLHDTNVESDQFRTTLKGDITLAADATAVGMTGSIVGLGGDVDLFDRRYRVERAAVRFDGTVDPLLDVRITHDFPDVTTITQVRGRGSKPELELSSEPGMYSKSQLLGFLLGGEPGGDPTSGSARDKAAEAGASFIANQIAGYMRSALPFDIDVIRYEAASSTSSAAITVGSWITHTLFFSFRQHLEARPDENGDEGTLEWWLTHRLEVEATAGDRNFDGVDMLWRRRF